MIRIDMDMLGVDELVERIETAAEELMPRLKEAIDDCTFAIEADAKMNVPRDTRTLLSNITAVPAVASGDKVIGRTIADTEYAIFVEFGTGASGEASGGNGSSYEAGYTMSHGGMAAQPYMYPAYKANQTRIVGTLKEAVRI